MFIVWGIKMIFIIITTIILGVCTYTDIKGKYIYTWVCGLSSAAAIIAHAFLKDTAVKNIGLGVLIGALAFVVSIISKDKFGRGDAWVMTTIGAMEGGIMLIPVIIWTLIFFNIYAISGISLKFFNMKSKLPLVPFALVANVLVAFLTGGKI